MQIDLTNPNLVFQLTAHHVVEKEGKNSDVNDEKSPPISSRLQELSNNLKNLLSATPVCKKISDASKTDCSATPLCIKMREEENDASYNNVEPKTPANQGMKDNRCEVTNVNGPWEALSVRNSEVKV